MSCALILFAAGIDGERRQYDAVSDAASLCADNRLPQVAAASDVDTSVQHCGALHATELHDVLAPDHGQLNCGC